MRCFVLWMANVHEVPYPGWQSASDGPLKHCSSKPARKAQPGAKPNPKKGARSVSTLTAAQLERKRASDREAQRVIRQRTRNYIALLEQSVVNPTAKSDPDETLRRALRRNQELERENAILRSRLNDAVKVMAESGGTYHSFPNCVVTLVREFVPMC
jgi:hypothetical protein